MAYQIKLEVFEGPLDLLLHLIEKAQVDICDIPIAQITEQYLAYLATMQKLDLDVASEFLLMAATLLQIKSRMLLPAPPPPALTEDGGEEGIDPRQELIERLIEYKRFKEAAEALAELARRQEKIFTRMPLAEVRDASETQLEGLSLDDLVLAFTTVLASTEAEYALIPREEVTVQDKMQEIIRRLRVTEGQGLKFQTLFTRRSSRTEIITVFLALLELIRLRQIRVVQSCPFGEIILYRAGGEKGSSSDTPGTAGLGRTS